MYFRHIVELRIDSYKAQQHIADLLNCKREVYRRCVGVHVELICKIKYINFAKYGIINDINHRSLIYLVYIAFAL